ncbi:cytochrome P450 [Dietzia sp. PP-33]|jgi:cytochrome P450|uniref:cytochrome P450 n=1 Tax=Dietzia sp. PP-33 TaxID=2957500 RepID=UPI0029A0D05E|nr:cytochrome P450 [Dietzia sp. PP-33]MDX2358637.1 cytochrome P450 [Dietzia sp. PP-33]
MQSADDVMDMLAPSRRSPGIERIAESSFYAVRAWDLVAEATERVEDFSSNLTATMVVGPNGEVTEFPVAELGSPVHALATADGEVHRAHRKLVLPSLSPRTLRAWRPFIDQQLRDLWAEGYRGGGIDWVGAIAERLPSAAVAKLMGLPARDSDRLCEWAFASTRMLDGMVSSGELEESVRSVGELVDYLSGGLTRARSAGGNSVIGDLARLVEDGDLTHDVAVQVLVQLVAAGIESTVGHLGSLVWRLGRHPEYLATLRSDPTSRPLFIEETLRTEAPFRGHYRHVTRDTELGGTALAAGTHLFLLWGTANRDHRRFHQPEQFTPDRAEGSHLSFGRGIHFCVGAALARMESLAALDFLLGHGSDLQIDVSDARWHQSLLVRRLRTLTVSVGDGTRNVDRP